MEPLTFTAVYKSKRCKFEISPVSGGNGAWHLYIDQYFYGKFTNINDRWKFLPQHDHYFTPVQIAILEDQLEKHLVG